MTEQEQKPTMHDSWLAERDRGQKLHNMLQHPGWTEVLAPHLKGLREGMMNDLLSEKISDYNGYVFVRQTVNAIDGITKGISAILALGEKAAQNLKKETEDE